MKKIFLIITGFAWICTAAFAVNPPSEVQKSFEQKFPKAVNVKWEKENAKEWEAAFNFNGEKLSANFTNAGSWVETEKKIAVSDLPIPVTQAVNKKYPAWKIIGAEKTETAKNAMIYEAIIKSGSHKKEVAFKADGAPVIE